MKNSELFKTIASFFSIPVVNSINCAAPCLSRTLFSSRILLYKKQIVTADKKKLVQSGQVFFLYRNLVQSGQVFCTQKKNCTVCILKYTDYEFCFLQLQLQFFCIFFQESEWVKRLLPNEMRLGPKKVKFKIYKCPKHFFPVVFLVQKTNRNCTHKKKVCSLCKLSAHRKKLVQSGQVFFLYRKLLQNKHGAAQFMNFTPVWIKK